MGGRAPALLVGDRGFQLGDGLFETLRVRRGVAIEIELHLARLREGMGILAIPMPFTDEELAAAIVRSSLPTHPTTPRSGSPSVVAHRAGAACCRRAGASWARRSSSRPGRTSRSAPGVLARGVRAVIATGRRDPAHPLASVKTTSRADHVHAKLEAELAGADDAITLTIDGHVAEATTANVASDRR